MKSCCLSGVHMKGVAQGYSLYREYTSAN